MLPTSRYWRLLQRIHAPGTGQLSQISRTLSRPDRDGLRYPHPEVLQIADPRPFLDEAARHRRPLRRPGWLTTRRSLRVSPRTCPVVRHGTQRRQGARCGRRRAGHHRPRHHLTRPSLPQPPVTLVANRRHPDWRRSPEPLMVGIVTLWPGVSPSPSGLPTSPPPTVTPLADGHHEPLMVTTVNPLAWCSDITLTDPGVTGPAMEDWRR